MNKINKKTILVVDDSKVLRNFFEESLGEYDFNVILAENGLEGKLMLKRFEPDLVILDLLMARVNGFDFLREKRDMPNLSDIPVIAMSSINDKSVLETAKKLGAVDFILKPVLLPEVIRKIDIVFAIKRQNDSETEKSLILDLYVNNRIIYVEVEGFITLSKLHPLKFKIKELIELYKLKDLKFFYLIKGLDNENITNTLIYPLFAFFAENEIKAEIEDIKILCGNNLFLQALQRNNFAKNIEVVADFFEGLTKLGMSSREFGESLLDASTKYLKKDEVILDMPEEIQLDRFDLKVKAFAGSKVMIVEDSQDILDLCEIFLQKIQFETFKARNGKECLENISDFKPDLILLDLMMPEIDGFQVLESILQKKLKIPIIVISSLNNIQSVMQAKKLGAKAYIVKPFIEDELIRKIMEVIGSEIGL